MSDRTTPLPEPDVRERSVDDAVAEELVERARALEDRITLNNN